MTLSSSPCQKRECYSYVIEMLSADGIDGVMCRLRDFCDVTNDASLRDDLWALLDAMEILLLLESGSSASAGFETSLPVHGEGR